MTIRRSMWGLVATLLAALVWHVTPSSVQGIAATDRAVNVKYSAPAQWESRTGESPQRGSPASHCTRLSVQHIIVCWLHGELVRSTPVATYAYTEIDQPAQGGRSDRSGTTVDEHVDGGSANHSWVMAERAVAADTADEAAGDAADDPADATCGGNSFTPDTTVVMADGSTKPLDQVKVGDKVEATDTATGKTSAQTVTTVWVNHDSDLMDVTIEAGGKTSVIQATQHYLFWDVTRKAWVEADQLVAGDQLQTDTGTVATVAGAVVVPGAADMWDLTVNNDHDFYVVTSSAYVLVHNCLDRGPKQGSGQSQLPSWYSNGGYGLEAGETPAQATTRIFNDRYGEGNYPRGPNTEFNKVQKYISRRGAGGG